MSDFRPIAPEPKRKREQPPALKKAQAEKAEQEAQIMDALKENFGDYLEDGELRMLVRQLVDMCQARKKIRVVGACPTCNCKHPRYVEVVNETVALKAHEILYNRVLGRPGQAEVEQAGTVVKYTIVGATE